jgi:hypothetical protein
MGLPDDNPSSFGDHYGFGGHAGLEGLHCTSFDAKNIVFVDAGLTLRLLPGVKQKIC